MFATFSSVPPPTTPGSHSPSRPTIEDARQFSSNVPTSMPLAIFLDSGDVINDNKLRGPQWIDMIGTFVSSTPLGGPGELWGIANGKLVHKLHREGLWYDLLQKCESHKVLDRLNNLLWANECSQFVNGMILEARKKRLEGAMPEAIVTKEDYSEWPLVVLPEDEEDVILISVMMHLYCLAHVKADLPGAVEAIKTLKQDQGFEMYTCSEHWVLELLGDTMTTTLEKIRKRVQDYATRYPDHATVDILGPNPKEPVPVFTQIYGPDLVDAHKNSTRFYAEIFRDCGVDPREAIVVDDKEHMLSWAKVLGVRTVLISSVDRTGREMLVCVPDPEDNSKTKLVPAVDHQLNSLAELPLLTAYWKKQLQK
ncbi:hypothetical protein MVEG_02536 [Podila verticillata NRRL 6337]|nr:hypothetical protein MVEG_02536 [Podila verticillata NRRL 6337]